MNFAFVASQFYGTHDRTDWYCRRFLDKFAQVGIDLGKVSVVDGRMTPAQSQRTADGSDLVWLAGGW